MLHGDRGTIRLIMRALKKIRRPAFGFFIAAVYSYANVIGAYAAESNLWAERRRAAQKLKATPGLSQPIADLGLTADKPASSTENQTLLAQLPAASQINIAMPPSLSVGAGLGNPGSLPFPSHALSHSSLRAAAQAKGIPAWLSSLVLPYGSVRDIFLAKNPGAPLIVHLQDAHALPEAQRNQAHMIEGLSRERGINLVGLEGAQGGFALEPYRAFDMPEVTKQIADYFIEEGEISGAEYVGLTANAPPLLWGVEDLALYQENIQAFKDSLPDNEAVKKTVDGLDQALAQLKRGVYSHELSAFDRHTAAFQDHTESLGDYVRYLMDIPAPSRTAFPNLRLLLSALDWEESLDFKQVERERAQLVELMVKRLSEKQLNTLVQQSLFYRMGRVSYGDYHRFLQQLCADNKIPLEKFGQMSSYIRYVLLAERIDRDELFVEMSLLEVAAQEELAQTPEQNAVISLARRLALMRKLTTHSMTQADWLGYLKEKDAIQRLPDDLRRAAVLTRQTVQSPDVEDLPGLLKPYEDFCHLAIQRNKHLIDNLLAKMLQQKTAAAVLVAGGFHSEGLTQILRQKDVSYVVITPRITEVPADTNYLDAAFAHDQAPLEKILSGEKIYLAAQPGTAITTESILPSKPANLQAKYIVRFVGIQSMKDKFSDFLKNLPALAAKFSQIKNVAVSVTQEKSGAVLSFLVQYRDGREAAFLASVVENGKVGLKRAVSSPLTATHTLLVAPLSGLSATLRSWSTAPARLVGLVGFSRFWNQKNSPLPITGEAPATPELKAAPLQPVLQSPLISGLTTAPRPLVRVALMFLVWWGLSYFAFPLFDNALSALIATPDSAGLLHSLISFPLVKSALLAVQVVVFIMSNAVVVLALVVAPLDELRRTKWGAKFFAPFQAMAKDYITLSHSAGKSNKLIGLVLHVPQSVVGAVWGFFGNDIVRLRAVMTDPAEAFEEFGPQRPPSRIEKLYAKVPTYILRLALFLPFLAGALLLKRLRLLAFSTISQTLLVSVFTSVLWMAATQGALVVLVLALMGGFFLFKRQRVGGLVALSLAAAAAVLFFALGTTAPGTHLLWSSWVMNANILNALDFLPGMGVGAAQGFFGQHPLLHSLYQLASPFAAANAMVLAATLAVWDQAAKHRRLARDALAAQPAIQRAPAFKSSGRVALALPSVSSFAALLFLPIAPALVVVVLSFLGILLLSSRGTLAAWAGGWLSPFQLAFIDLFKGGKVLSLDAEGNVIESSKTLWESTVSSFAGLMTVNPEIEALKSMSEFNAQLHGFVLKIEGTGHGADGHFDKDHFGVMGFSDYFSTQVMAPLGFHSSDLAALAPGTEGRTADEIRMLLGQKEYREKLKTILDKSRAELDSLKTDAVSLEEGRGLTVDRAGQWRTLVDFQIRAAEREAASLRGARQILNASPEDRDHLISVEKSLNDLRALDASLKENGGRGTRVPSALLGALTADAAREVSQLQLQSMILEKTSTPEPRAGRFEKFFSGLQESARRLEKFWDWGVEKTLAESSAYSGWVDESQRLAGTPLVESYVVPEGLPSAAADREAHEFVKDMASTYDNMLVVLDALERGNTERAREILHYFADKGGIPGRNSKEFAWNKDAGDALWVGLAAAKFTAKAGPDPKITAMMARIGDFALEMQRANENNEQLKGSLRAGKNGNQLKDHTSTEHNLDALAFFGMMYRLTGEVRYHDAQRGVARWLAQKAYIPGEGRFYAGHTGTAMDRQSPTDTSAWGVAVLKGVEAADFQLFDETGLDDISISGLIQSMERNRLNGETFVTPDGRERGPVDVYTFAPGAPGSFEFTDHVVLAKKLSGLSGQEADARKILDGLDGVATEKEGRKSLPYATRFGDTHVGWHATPYDAVAPTVWYTFADNEYNPFAYDEMPAQPARPSIPDDPGARIPQEPGDEQGVMLDLKNNHRDFPLKGNSAYGEKQFAEAGDGVLVRKFIGQDGQEYAEFMLRFNTRELRFDMTKEDGRTKAVPEDVWEKNIKDGRGVVMPDLSKLKERYMKMAREQFLAKNGRAPQAEDDHTLQDMAYEIGAADTSLRLYTAEELYGKPGVDVRIEEFNDPQLDGNGKFPVDKDNHFLGKWEKKQRVVFTYKGIEYTYTAGSAITNREGIIEGTHDANGVKLKTPIQPRGVAGLVERFMGGEDVKEYKWDATGSVGEKPTGQKGVNDYVIRILIDGKPRYYTVHIDAAARDLIPKAREGLGLLDPDWAAIKDPGVLLPIIDATTFDNQRPYPVSRVRMADNKTIVDVRLPGQQGTVPYIFNAGATIIGREREIMEAGGRFREDERGLNTADKAVLGAQGLVRALVGVDDISQEKLVLDENGRDVSDTDRGKFKILEETEVNGRRVVTYAQPIVDRPGVFEYRYLVDGKFYRPVVSSMGNMDAEVEYHFQREGLARPVYDGGTAPDADPVPLLTLTGLSDLSKWGQRITSVEKENDTPEKKGRVFISVRLEDGRVVRYVAEPGTEAKTRTAQLNAGRGAELQLAIIAPRDLGGSGPYQEQERFSYNNQETIVYKARVPDADNPARMVDDFIYVVNGVVYREALSEDAKARTQALETSPAVTTGLVPVPAGLAEAKVHQKGWENNGGVFSRKTAAGDTETIVQKGDKYFRVVGSEKAADVWRTGRSQAGVFLVDWATVQDYGKHVPHYTFEQLLGAEARRVLQVREVKTEGKSKIQAVLTVDGLEGSVTVDGQEFKGAAVFTLEIAEDARSNKELDALLKADAAVAGLRPTVVARDARGNPKGFETVPGELNTFRRPIGKDPVTGDDAFEFLLKIDNRYYRIVNSERAEAKMKTALAGKGVFLPVWDPVRDPNARLPLYTFDEMAQANTITTRQVEGGPLYVTLQVPGIADPVTYVYQAGREKVERETKYNNARVEGSRVVGVPALEESIVARGDLQTKYERFQNGQWIPADPQAPVTKGLYRLNVGDTNKDGQNEFDTVVLKGDGKTYRIFSTDELEAERQKYAKQMGVAVVDLERISDVDDIPTELPFLAVEDLANINGLGGRIRETEQEQRGSITVLRFKIEINGRLLPYVLEVSDENIVRPVDAAAWVGGYPDPAAASVQRAGVGGPRPMDENDFRRNPQRFLANLRAEDDQLKAADAQDDAARDKWYEKQKSDRTPLRRSYEVPAQPAAGVTDATHNALQNDFSSSYDQALVSMDKIRRGDQVSLNEAREILDHFDRQGGVPGQNNLEWGKKDTGDILWIGMAAVQYMDATGDARYEAMTRRIADFVRANQKADGSIDRGNPYGADGHANSSTEHNLDALIFLGMMYRLTGDSQYREIQKGVARWLADVAYVPAEKRFAAGTDETGGINYDLPTDAQAWGVAVLTAVNEADPELYRETGLNRIDLDGLLDQANAKTLERNVTVAGPNGAPVQLSLYRFFTQPESAGSVEWSAEMGLGLKLRNRQAEALALLEGLDQLKKTAPDGAESYPYAVRSVTATGEMQATGGWAVTPYHSVAATAWMGFGKDGFNPFAYKDVKKAGSSPAPAPVQPGAPVDQSGTPAESAPAPQPGAANQAPTARNDPASRMNGVVALRPSIASVGELNDGSWTVERVENGAIYSKDIAPPPGYAGPPQKDYVFVFDGMVYRSVASPRAESTMNAAGRSEGYYVPDWARMPPGLRESLVKNVTLPVFTAGQLADQSQFNSSVNRVVQDPTTGRVTAYLNVQGVGEVPYQLQAGLESIARDRSFEGTDLVGLRKAAVPSSLLKGPLPEGQSANDKIYYYETSRDGNRITYRRWVGTREDLGSKYSLEFGFVQEGPNVFEYITEDNDVLYQTVAAESLSPGLQAAARGLGLARPDMGSRAIGVNDRLPVLSLADLYDMTKLGKHIRSVEQAKDAQGRPDPKGRIVLQVFIEQLNRIIPYVVESGDAARARADLFDQDPAVSGQPLAGLMPTFIPMGDIVLMDGLSQDDPRRSNSKYFVEEKRFNDNFRVLKNYISGEKGREIYAYIYVINGIAYRDVLTEGGKAKLNDAAMGAAGLGTVTPDYSLLVEKLFNGENIDFLQLRNVYTAEEIAGNTGATSHPETKADGSIGKITVLVNGEPLPLVYEPGSKVKDIRDVVDDNPEPAGRLVPAFITLADLQMFEQRFSKDGNNNAVPNSVIVRRVTAPDGTIVEILLKRFTNAQGDTEYYSPYSNEKATLLTKVTAQEGVFVTDLEYVTSPNEPLIVQDALRMETEAQRQGSGYGLISGVRTVYTEFREGDPSAAGKPKEVLEVEGRGPVTFTKEITRHDRLTLPGQPPVDVTLVNLKMSGELEKHPGPAAMQVRIVWGTNRDGKTLTENLLIQKDGHLEMVVQNSAARALWMDREVKLVRNGEVIELTLPLNDGVLMPIGMESGRIQDVYPADSATLKGLSGTDRQSGTIGLELEKIINPGDKYDGISPPITNNTGQPIMILKDNEGRHFQYIAGWHVYELQRDVLVNQAFGNLPMPVMVVRGVKESLQDVDIGAGIVVDVRLLKLLRIVDEDEIFFAPTLEERTEGIEEFKYIIEEKYGPIRMPVNVQDMLYMLVGGKEKIPGGPLSFLAGQPSYALFGSVFAGLSFALVLGNHLFKLRNVSLIPDRGYLKVPHHIVSVLLGLMELPLIISQLFFIRPFRWVASMFTRAFSPGERYFINLSSAPARSPKFVTKWFRIPWQRFRLGRREADTRKDWLTFFRYAGLPVDTDFDQVVDRLTLYSVYNDPLFADSADWLKDPEQQRATEDILTQLFRDMPGVADRLMHLLRENRLRYLRDEAMDSRLPIRAPPVNTYSSVLSAISDPFPDFPMALALHKLYFSNIPGQSGPIQLITREDIERVYNAVAAGYRSENLMPTRVSFWQALSSGLVDVAEAKVYGEIKSGAVFSSQQLRQILPPSASNRTLLYLLENSYQISYANESGPFSAQPVTLKTLRESGNPTLSGAIRHALRKNLLEPLVKDTLESLPFSVGGVSLYDNPEQNEDFKVFMETVIEDVMPHIQNRPAMLEGLKSRENPDISLFRLDTALNPTTFRQSVLLQALTLNPSQSENMGFGQYSAIRTMLVYLSRKAMERWREKRRLVGDQPDADSRRRMVATGLPSLDLPAYYQFISWMNKFIFTTRPYGGVNSAWRARTYTSLESFRSQTALFQIAIDLDLIDLFAFLMLSGQKEAIVEGSDIRKRKDRAKIAPFEPFNVDDAGKKLMSNTADLLNEFMEDKSLYETFLFQDQDVDLARLKPLLVLSQKSHNKFVMRRLSVTASSMGSLSKAKAVQGLNQILRLPEFYKQVAGLDSLNLPPSIRALLEKARSSNGQSLTENERIALNQTLLSVLYPGALTLKHPLGKSFVVYLTAVMSLIEKFYAQGKDGEGNNPVVSEAFVLPLAQAIKMDVTENIRPQSERFPRLKEEKEDGTVVERTLPSRRFKLLYVSVSVLVLIAMFGFNAGFDLTRMIPAAAAAVAGQSSSAAPFGEVSIAFGPNLGSVILVGIVLTVWGILLMTYKRDGPFSSRDKLQAFLRQPPPPASPDPNQPQSRWHKLLAFIGLAPTTPPDAVSVVSQSHPLDWTYFSLLVFTMFGWSYLTGSFVVFTAAPFVALVGWHLFTPRIPTNGRDANWQDRLRRLTPVGLLAFVGLLVWKVHPAMAFLVPIVFLVTKLYRTASPGGSWLLLSRGAAAVLLAAFVVTGSIDPTALMSLTGKISPPAQVFILGVVGLNVVPKMWGNWNENQKVGGVMVWVLISVGVPYLLSMLSQLILAMPLEQGGNVIKLALVGALVGLTFIMPVKSKSVVPERRKEILGMSFGIAVSPEKQGMLLFGLTAIGLSWAASISTWSWIALLPLVLAFYPWMVPKEEDFGFGELLKRVFLGFFMYPKEIFGLPERSWFWPISLTFISASIGLYLTSTSWALAFPFLSLMWIPLLFSAKGNLRTKLWLGATLTAAAAYFSLFLAPIFYQLGQISNILAFPPTSSFYTIILLLIWYVPTNLAFLHIRTAIAAHHRNKTDQWSRVGKSLAGFDYSFLANVRRFVVFAVASGVLFFFLFPTGIYTTNFSGYTFYAIIGHIFVFLLSFMRFRSLDNEHQWVKHFAAWYAEFLEAENTDRVLVPNGGNMQEYLRRLVGRLYADDLLKPKEYRDWMKALNDNDTPPQELNFPRPEGAIAQEVLREAFYVLGMKKPRPVSYEELLAMTPHVTTAGETFTHNFFEFGVPGSFLDFNVPEFRAEYLDEAKRDDLFAKLAAKGSQRTPFEEEIFNQYETLGEGFDLTAFLTEKLKDERLHETIGENVTSSIHRSQDRTLVLRETDPKNNLVVADRLLRLAPSGQDLDGKVKDTLAAMAPGFQLNNQELLTLNYVLLLYGIAAVFDPGLSEALIDGKPLVSIYSDIGLNIKDNPSAPFRDLAGRQFAHDYPEKVTAMHAAGKKGATLMGYMAMTHRAEWPNWIDPLLESLAQDNSLLPAHKGLLVNFLRHFKSEDFNEWEDVQGLLQQLMRNIQSTGAEAEKDAARRRVSLILQSLNDWMNEMRPADHLTVKSLHQERVEYHLFVAANDGLAGQAYRRALIHLFSSGYKGDGARAPYDSLNSAFEAIKLKHGRDIRLTEDEIIFLERYERYDADVRARYHPIFQSQLFWGNQIDVVKDKNGSLIIQRVGRGTVMNDLKQKLARSLPEASPSPAIDRLRSSLNTEPALNPKGMTPQAWAVSFVEWYWANLPLFFDPSVKELPTVELMHLFQIADTIHQAERRGITVPIHPSKDNTVGAKNYNISGNLWRMRGIAMMHDAYVSTYRGMEQESMRYVTEHRRRPRLAAATPAFKIAGSENRNAFPVTYDYKISQETFLSDFLRAWRLMSTFYGKGSTLRSMVLAYSPPGEDSHAFLLHQHFDQEYLSTQIPYYIQYWVRPSLAAESLTSTETRYAYNATRFIMDLYVIFLNPDVPFDKKVGHFYMWLHYFSTPIILLAIWFVPPLVLFGNFNNLSVIDAIVPSLMATLIFMQAINFSLFVRHWRQSGSMWKALAKTWHDIVKGFPFYVSVIAVLFFGVYLASREVFSFIQTQKDVRLSKSDFDNRDTQINMRLTNEFAPTWGWFGAFIYVTSVFVAAAGAVMDQTVFSAVGVFMFAGVNFVIFLAAMALTYGWNIYANFLRKDGRLVGYSPLKGWWGSILFHFRESTLTSRDFDFTIPRVNIRVRPFIWIYVSVLFVFYAVPMGLVKFLGFVPSIFRGRSGPGGAPPSAPTNGTSPSVTTPQGWQAALLLAGILAVVNISIPVGAGILLAGLAAASVPSFVLGRVSAKVLPDGPHASPEDPLLPKPESPPVKRGADGIVVQVSGSSENGLSLAERDRVALFLVNGMASLVRVSEVAAQTSVSVTVSRDVENRLEMASILLNGQKLPAAADARVISRLTQSDRAVLARAMPYSSPEEALDILEHKLAGEIRHLDGSPEKAGRAAYSLGLLAGTLSGAGASETAMSTYARVMPVIMRGLPTAPLHSVLDGVQRAYQLAAWVGRNSVYRQAGTQDQAREAAKRLGDVAGGVFHLPQGTDGPSRETALLMARAISQKAQEGGTQALLIVVAETPTDVEVFKGVKNAVVVSVQPQDVKGTDGYYHDVLLYEEILRLRPTAQTRLDDGALPIISPVAGEWVIEKKKLFLLIQLLPKIIGIISDDLLPRLEGLQQALVAA